MGKEILTFSDIETEKHKYYSYESPIFAEDVDIYNALVSNRISFGKKNYSYSIDYLYDDYKIKPLPIMLQKTSECVKSYDGQNNWMRFLIEDDDLLEKYNTIWEKVSADNKRNLIASLCTIKNI